MRVLTRHFKALYDFPADPAEQLDRAIRAVFDSWSGERAVAYRRINGIPDDWGTAVNVQQMVFGNRGERSCSGVRTPHDLSELRDWMPEAHAQLMDILWTLERHSSDMQDTEFTVEEGRLYMLQTGLQAGICGEHGGDPDSIHFCHDARLDYVSCSPFRVPVARVAAAQAAIRSIAGQ